MMITGPNNTPGTIEPTQVDVKPKIIMTENKMVRMNKLVSSAFMLLFPFCFIGLFVYVYYRTLYVKSQYLFT